MSRTVFEWREVAPDPIRTARASVATVRHAVPLVMDGTRRVKMRSLCGLMPKQSWQATSSALPECRSCRQALTISYTSEAK